MGCVIVIAGDQTTLGQILATLTNLGERLAVVEADLKTVIRDHTKDLDDHETRLRLLEADTRQHVTRDELASARASALVDADRKANLRLGILGALVLVVNVAISWFHT